MSREYNGQIKPERLGNSFPWVGILKGVGRMIFYVVLLACALIVLGAVAALLIALVIPNDAEVIGQFG
jgi:hypothetical protein